MYTYRSCTHVCTSEQQKKDPDIPRMMQNSFIAVQQLSKMVEKFGRLDAQSLRCLELVMAVETTGRKATPATAATETETETVANALPATVTNGVLQFFEEETSRAVF